VPANIELATPFGSYIAFAAIGMSHGGNVHTDRTQLLVMTTRGNCQTRAYYDFYPVPARYKIPEHGQSQ